ncbi:MAG: SusE domain-containing protein [Hymenobacter sp.]|nr:SusE domain-containing protein [Hymenobacter sp.]
MKKWLPQTMAGAFALAILTLTACEKDDAPATLTPASTPTLSASATSAVLTQATSAQAAIVYTWTPAGSLSWSKTDYPYSPTITYALQLSTPENDFGAPASIPAGTGPTTTLTVEQLNTALSTLGLMPAVATTINVRLAAIINSATNNPVVSAVVPLTVTPYKVCLPPSADTWSIIGPAGVDWDTDIPLTYNCDTRTYDATRPLNAGEFKFRRNRDWTLNYGSNVVRDATGNAPLTSSGNNITVPTPGRYTVSLNLNTLTYSLKQ